MSTINKEELVKYLKDNLDITINLDLKFGTDNISRLNFKQDKPITRGRFRVVPLKTVMI